MSSDTIHNSTHFSLQEAVLGLSLDYPLMLVPVAATERVSIDDLAWALGMSQHEVRAFGAFARDVLISRAVELGALPEGWRPKTFVMQAFLAELSVRIMQHWSHLFTPREREEQIHIRTLCRHIRRLKGK